MAFITENIFLIAIAVASGAMLLWPVVMGRVAAGAGLDPLAATRLINDRNPVVVDMRSAADYSAGHLINAKHIPAESLDQRVGELPAKRPVLLYCASGMRSGRAIGTLRKHGREEVFSLTGGIQAWSQAGLPTVK